MEETVLSPFLPGTSIQFAWDSTSLGYIKTCPRLYQYIMIEGWSPKEDSVHLRFGIEFHKALEEYDLFRHEGNNHNAALRMVIHNILIRVKEWDPDPTTKAGNYKNPNTLVSLVIDYLDKFADDPAKTVIRESGRPATEVSFRFELDWGPQAAPDTVYVLSGHLDRVVDYNGQTLVMDRKTTTTTPSSYYFDQFAPNNQMSLYTIAGQIVLGAPIKGVIIDAAQILLEKPNNFTRGFTFRTPDQSQEWLNDLRFWFHQAETYALANYWPMNDTACDKFGGCKFRGVCSKDPSVRQRFLEADFIKLAPEERWNPLKPR